MDISVIGTVLAIVVITYLIELAMKQILQVKDELIPVVVGTSGGILGIIGMYVIPDFPASDILNAIAVGIVSGIVSLNDPPEMVHRSTFVILIWD